MREWSKDSPFLLTPQWFPGKKVGVLGSKLEWERQFRTSIIILIAVYCCNPFQINLHCMNHKKLLARKQSYNVKRCFCSTNN